jgi:hypothetical protein
VLPRIAFFKEKMKDQVKRMELGMIQLLKMKQGVERILHVPGNYKGGILEMALVIDCNLDKQTAKERVQAMVKALKSHSETFRNVRLNVIWWKTDEEIVTEVMPMAVLQIGTPFESYEKMAAQKRIDGLFANLKLFQARSKLILLLSDGEFGIEQEENCMESLKPFLGRKMLLMLDEISEEIERLALKGRMITLEV